MSLPVATATIDVDGVSTASHYGDVSAEVGAIRRGVAVSAAPHATCLRVSGEDAFDALDRIIPVELYVRDGQARQTLLLNADGTILADVYVANDDDGWLLFAEGAPRSNLITHLRDRIGDKTATVDDLTEEGTVISLHGPFAWELLAALEGEDVIGFPYLSFYRPRPGSIYLRAGKTGEFGYDMLVPRAEAPGLLERILDRGGAYDVKPVGVLAQWHCGLENWFFNVHREGRSTLSAVELGLQWRVSYRKDYPGADALLLRRRTASERVVPLRSREPIAAGMDVVASDTVIGRVLHAERSATLGDWVAIGVLQTRHAQSGIDRYRARSGETTTPILTVSAPFIDNLSLYVNPQQHRYSGREVIAFPGSDRIAAASPP